MSSKIILGTVQMGLDYGVYNTQSRISFDESNLILNQAFKYGIELVDTAELYGKAHSVIGQFHLHNPDMKFNVITKLPHDIQDSQIEKKILDYLLDLNVESIEILMFHSFISYMKQYRIIKGINRQYKNVHYRKIGVSVYTNDELNAVSTDPNIDVIQVPFNLLDNESQRGDLLRKAKLVGKEIHVRSVFLQGLFFLNKKNIPTKLDELKAPLDMIKHIANEFDIGISSLAIKYPMSKEYIDKVLIGVNSIDQLNHNLTSINKEVPNEVFERIDNIKVLNYDLLNPSKW